MITNDRADLRVFFTSLVVAALEGPSKPCAKVYNHQTADFGTLSPVLVVTEAGTEWMQLTLGGPMMPKAHFLAVHAFVLYATANGSIGEDDSEAMLSPIQEGLAGVVQANRVGKKTVDGETTNYWSSIAYEARSQVEPVKIKGQEYRHEWVVLKFQ
jgi:hypothetical protein